MYTILGIEKEFESIEKAIQFIQNMVRPHTRTNRTPVMKIYKGTECILKLQVVSTVTTETHFID